MHHPLRLRQLALPVLLALTTGAAQADRPLVSETADVIDGGDCQLEASVGRWRESGTANPTLADALVSCGVGGHSQFGLTLAGVRGDGSTDKLVGLGGKTTLRAPQDGATGFAVAYAIWWDKLAGEGWHHGGHRLFGVVTRELAKDLLGHLNLGWLRTASNQRNHTTWSVGVEGDGPLGWAADVFGDDRSRPWLSGGVIVPVTDKLSLNLAYAQQFETPRVHLWTLGLKVEFQ